MIRAFSCLIIICLIMGVITPVFALTSNDPLYSKQLYLPFINIEKAWDYQTGSKDVIVAVIDTGVDINHPDLFENIWQNSDEINGDGIDNDGNGYVDDINGWDFIRQQADPKPKFDYEHNSTGMEHGTLVAGIIGAMGNNGYGVSGINWQVSIMPLIALDGKGAGLMSDVVAAINYAVNNDADIINLSLVGSVRDSSLDQAIANAASRGVLVVAAVGNEKVGEHNTDLSVDLGIQPRFPVCSEVSSDEVLGVGSIDYQNYKSLFSNYGKCLDINAPGQSFYGLNLYYPAVSGYQDKFTGYWSGTSMATPIISGIAALLKATDSSLTNKQLVALIKDNATNIDNYNYLYQGKMGAGKINIDHIFEKIAQQSINKNLLIATNKNNTQLYFYNKKLELTKNITLNLQKIENYQLVPIVYNDQNFVAVQVNQKILIFNEFGQNISEWPISIKASKISNWQNRIIVNNNKDVVIYGLDGTELLSFITKGIDDLQIIDIDNDQIADLVMLFKNKLYIYSQLGILKNTITLNSNLSLTNFTYYNNSIIANQLTKKESSIVQFDLSGKIVKSFIPYQRYSKKVIVKVWQNQILTVPSENGGPHLKIYDSQIKLVKEKFIADNKNNQGLDIYVN